MSQKRGREETDDEIDITTVPPTKQLKTSTTSDKNDVVTFTTQDDINLSISSHNTDNNYEEFDDLLDYFEKEDFDKFMDDLEYIKPDCVSKMSHTLNLIQKYPKHIQYLYKVYIKSNPILTTPENSMWVLNDSKLWFDYITNKLQHDMDYYLSFKYKQSIYKYHISSLKYSIKLQEELCKLSIQQFNLSEQYCPAFSNFINKKYTKDYISLQKDQISLQKLLCYSRKKEMQYLEFMKTRTYLNKL